MTYLGFEDRDKKNPSRKNKEGASSFSISIAKEGAEQTRVETALFQRAHHLVCHPVVLMFPAVCSAAAVFLFLYG